MDSQNFAEYLVKKKPDAALNLRKFLMVGGVSIAVGVTVALLFKPLIAVIPFVFGGGGVLLWFLWRYVNIEYEYTIISGDITFDTIYGERKRKRSFEAKIRDFELIAPVEEKFLHRLQSPDISVRYDFSSSPKSPDLYFAIYNDSNKGKALIIFDTIPRTLKLLKFYNPSCFNAKT